MRVPLLGLALLASIGCGGASKPSAPLDVASLDEKEAGAGVFARAIPAEVIPRVSIRVVDTETMAETGSAVDAEERSIAVCAATRIAIAVDGAPLSEVLSHLAEVAPLRLQTDWQVNDEVGEAIVHGLSYEGPLNVVLDLLTGGFGLIPIYGDDQVLVTRPEYAVVATVERWYAIPPEVDGAVIGSVPPQVQLVDPDVVEDMGWGSDDLEPVLPYGDADIAELVKSAIDPECWSVRDFSVERSGDHLRVRCSTRIHRAVGEFLGALAKWAQTDTSAAQPHRD